MISFRSKITQKLLNYFFLNPEQEHYVNEMARILDEDPKNVYRKLKELETTGLLKTEWSGKQCYFSLNQNCNLFNEYKKIVTTTIGLPSLIKESLKDVEGLKRAYLFGSFVSDQMDASSDIDILLVGSHSMVKAHSPLWGLQSQFQREFNIVDMSEKEFAQKTKEKDAFLNDIFSREYIKII